VGAVVVVVEEVGAYAEGGGGRGGLGWAGCEGA
jgi:hypothetical protein